MNTNKTKYSQIALIIAAVAAVASLVFTIIYSGFTLASQICLGVGVVALAVSILLDPEDMRAFFSGRQAGNKHGQSGKHDPQADQDRAGPFGTQMADGDLEDVR